MVCQDVFSTGGETMNEVLDFQIDNIEFLEETNKMKFSKVRIKCFSSGLNAHKKPVLASTLKEKAPTILDVPLVWKYSAITDDATGHSDLGIPCGFVTNNENTITLEEDEEGKLWLTAEALIWKRYSGKLIEILKRDDAKKPVSVEMLVFETQKNEEGLEEIVNFTFTAICILGTNVKPAIEDAELEVIEFSKDKQETLEFFEKEKEITNFPKQGDNKKISLKNSSYPQFDYEYAQSLKEEYPEIWKKGGNTRGNEAFDLWGKARNNSNSKSVLAWIKEREAWAARHHKDKNIAGVVANVKWGTIVEKGEEYMKNLIDEEKNKQKEEEFSQKENLIINSEKNVNKEGEKMFKKSEFVENFGMTANDMWAMMSQTCESAKYKNGDEEYCKYWLSDYDEAYMYAWDCENGGKAAIPYTYEDGKVVPNFEEVKPAKLVSKWVIESDEEEMESSVYMELIKAEGKFANDANTENAAAIVLNEKETEDNKELIEEGKEDETKEDMSAKVEEMQAQINSLEEENSKLKEFKAQFEQKEKQARVEFAINAVSKVMPKERMEHWSSEEIVDSYENIELWENAVKADAFNYSMNFQEDTNKTKKIGLPYSQKPEKSGMWNSYKQKNNL
jgi:hypothetical protein